MVTKRSIIELVHRESNWNDWKKADAYHNSFLIPHDEALEFALENSVKNGIDDINVSAAQGKLLSLFATSIGAKKILEIGTLAG